jgi:dTDP-4-amino-4,6-dideoxygalactose transaminase
MCPSILRKKLEVAKKDNRLPKVIIPVHMAGQSCEMQEISQIAREYDVKIIEDASHAIGASYKNNKAGSCVYSDITIFSFHPVKIITTAEGGVATTNNPELATSLELFRSHGVTRDLNLMKNKSHGPWYYEQVDLGYNYRMTEIQASLGNSQFKRLDEFVKRRNELAVRYEEIFKDMPFKTFYPKDHIYSSFHLYIIQLEDTSKRLKVFNHLRDSAVGVNLHYIPVYFQPYYQSLDYSDQFNCPNAEVYYEGAISIPLFYDLKESDQDYILEKIKEVL